MEKENPCTNWLSVGWYNRLGDVEQGLYGEDGRKNPPRLRKECEDCVFSPKCYGGCESNYLKSADPCMVDRYIIPAYMRVILDDIICPSACI